MLKRLLLVVMALCFITIPSVVDAQNYHEVMSNLNLFEMPSGVQLTRENFTQEFASFFDLPEAEEPFNFSDVKEQYRDTVNRVVSSGITLGINDKTYGADENLTILTLVTFCLRAMDHESPGTNIYFDAETLAKQLQLIDDEEDLLRYAKSDDLAKIMYRSLFVPRRGSLRPYANYLVDTGIMEEKQILSSVIPQELRDTYTEGKDKPEQAVAFARLGSNAEYQYMTAVVTATDEKGEAHSEVGEMEGVDCLVKIDKTQYWYFTVDKNVIRPTDKNVTVRITYFDSGTSRMGIEYNTSDITAPNQRYKSHFFNKTNTMKWKTRDIVLTDAAFAGLQNNGGDFRLNFIASPSNEYVSKVEAWLTPKKNPNSPAFIDFTGDEVVFEKLTYSQSSDTTQESYWTHEEHDGESVAKIINSTKYLYVNVADDYIFTKDSLVDITITYFDNSNTPIRLQYNSTDATVSNPVYKQIYIPRTNTNEWTTTTINIVDASFMNRQNNAADFRIGPSSGDIFYLMRMVIEKPKPKKEKVDLGDSSWAKRENIGIGVKTQEMVYDGLTDRVLKCDVYLPNDWKVMDNRPVLVMLTGDATEQSGLSMFAKAIAGNGTVVIVQHTTEGTLSETIVNSKKLIKWVKDSSDSLGVNKSLVYAGGVADGGFLAIMTNFDDVFSGANLNSEARTKGLVLISPTLDSKRTKNFALTNSVAEDLNAIDGKLLIDNAVFFQGGVDTRNPGVFAEQASRRFGNFVEYYMLSTEGDNIISFDSFEAGKSVGYPFLVTKTNQFIGG